MEGKIFNKTFSTGEICRANDFAFVRCNSLLWEGENPPCRFGNLPADQVINIINFLEFEKFQEKKFN